MTEENRITGYVSIRNNQVIADGKLLFEKQNVSPNDFFNSAYEALDINYPRFFKMDNLCKTGFLASEILLRHKKTKESLSAEETGILFYTANSSLDTDILYHASSLDVSSPSLFVYTLPNIIIGELCIRHGIKGESGCFIFDIFNAGFEADYLNSLLDSGKIKAGISGWADFYNEKFEALFYIAGKSRQESLNKHNAENVDKIYREPWNN